MAAAVIGRSKLLWPATAPRGDDVVTGGVLELEGRLNLLGLLLLVGRLPLALAGIDPEAEEALLARRAARWLVRWTHRLDEVVERVPLVLALEQGVVVCHAGVLLIAVRSSA
jgi:hypothetical protein